MLMVRRNSLGEHRPALEPDEEHVERAHDVITAGIKAEPGLLEPFGGHCSNEMKFEELASLKECRYTTLHVSSSQRRTTSNATPITIRPMNAAPIGSCTGRVTL